MIEQPNTPEVDQVREHRILERIHKACNGDLQAVEDLFLIISDRIDPYCKSRVSLYGCYRGNWKDDEDFRQDAKLKIWLALNQARTKCKDDEHFINWCKKLARNIFIDEKRRARKEDEWTHKGPIPDDYALPGPPPQELLADQLSDELFSELSPEDREIVQLSAEGYNTRQISKILLERHGKKVSHARVARHLKKALAPVLAKLASDGPYGKIGRRPARKGRRPAAA